MKTTCFICGFARQDKYKVTHHLKGHLAESTPKIAKNIRKEIDRIKSTIVPKRCTECFKVFSSEKGLKYHIKSGVCYTDLKPDAFKSNLICKNIERYAENIEDIEKVLTTCQSKMKEIKQEGEFEMSVIDPQRETKTEPLGKTPIEIPEGFRKVINKTLDTKTQTEIEHQMRNFYHEDLSHCSRYVEFYVKYIQKVFEIRNCPSVLTRFYEIIYLNRDYSWNHNIQVDNDDFVSPVKLYIDDNLHYVECQPFFIQILIHHLCHMIVIVAKNMIHIDETGKEQPALDHEKVESSLSDFFDNYESRIRLGKHLYYLTYRFDNPEREISLNQFPGYQSEIVEEKSEIVGDDKSEIVDDKSEISD